jgi:two-component system chemotaxis response regulator CheY
MEKSPVKKILLIEDSELIRMEVRDALKNRASYQLTEAHDGDAGYAILSNIKDSFDLVILDYRMPGMTGVEMLRKLAEKNKKVTCPVLMITTEVEAKGSEVKDLNIISWVVKPIHKLRFENLVVQIFDYVETAQGF